MKGKYRIQCSRKGVYWDIGLNRKITVISGDSGTGKTSLCEALMGRTTKCSVPVSVVLFAAKNIDLVLLRAKTLRNSIIVIDEPGKFFCTHEVLSAIKESDCYFLIISREQFTSAVSDRTEYCELCLDGTTIRTRELLDDIDNWIELHHS